jgi:hypothetical protein
MATDERTHAHAAELDLGRLELAELASHLPESELALQDYRSGTRAPAMPADRRAEKIAMLEIEVDDTVRRIAKLSELVPDPDAVVASDGSTPPQRRLAHLPLYLERRREARAAVAAEILYVETVAADKSVDAKVRRRAREELRSLETRLEVIDGEPSDNELLAEDMCPDAIHPLSHHGWSWTVTKPTWPCGAWPSQRDKLKQVSTLLNQFEASRRAEDLVRWEITLLCGHSVEKTAHHTNGTYAPTGTLSEGCSVCGVKPAFVVDRQDRGRLAPAANAGPTKPPVSKAKATALRKRKRELQAELLEIENQLTTS